MVTTIQHAEQARSGKVEPVRVGELLNKIEGFFGASCWYLARLKQLSIFAMLSPDKTGPRRCTHTSEERHVAIRRDIHQFLVVCLLEQR